MHHLAAYTDDDTMPARSRESDSASPIDRARWSFVASDPMPKEPADDAQTIRDECLHLLSGFLTPKNLLI